MVLAGRADKAVASMAVAVTAAEVKAAVQTVEAKSGAEG